MKISKLNKYIILLSIFSLTNCSDLKKGFGLEKDVPDEFLIRKIDPIQRPPNYDLLPPDSKSSSKSLKKRENTTIKSIIRNSLKTKKETAQTDNSNVNSGNIEENILKTINK